MFEIEKTYTITTIEFHESGPIEKTCTRCRIKKINLPLIEVTGMRVPTEMPTPIPPERRELPTILNTTSPAFLCAKIDEPQMTDDEWENAKKPWQR